VRVDGDDRGAGTRQSSPGRMPARNRSITDRPVTAAIRMARPEGGMIGPTMDEAAVTAAAYSRV
jgi:hypothetical protein